jgi:O-antigen ligase
MPAFLLVWAVGCQTSELIATVGLVGTVLCAVVCAWRQEQRPNVALLRAWLPLWLFVAWAILGPLAAGHTPKGSGLGRLSDLCAIPFAAYAFSRLSDGWRRRVLVAAGGVMLASCICAGLQSYGIWPSQDTMHHWFKGVIRTDRVYEAVSGSPRRFMGGGLLFHRLKFAHVTGLVVLVALVLAVRANEARDRRMAFVVAAAGLISVALFPFVRAALFALVMSAALALALAYGGGRRALLAVGLILLVALGAVLVSPGLRARFQGSLTSEGSGERGALWQTGLTAVRTHPITGVGAGRFRPNLFASAETPKAVLEHPGKAHNQFLTLAAETGIVGLLLFVYLLVWLGRSMGKGSARAAIGRSALVYFVLLSLLHDPLFHAPFSMALALVLGGALGAGLTRAQVQGTEQSAV